jgi:hypothetical protein
MGQGCSAVFVRVSPSPTSGPKRDTTVCKGSSLSASVSIPIMRATTSYTVTTIPHVDTLPCESAGSLIAGAGITIDDGYSAIQNIGFNFCFFGVQQTQMQICDNGFLTFSTNKPVLGANSAPFVTRKLPLSAHPNPSSGATTLPPNSILGAWMDTYLVTTGSNPGGGTITTQLVGTAPFRAYIVKWNNCRFFNSACRPDPNMVVNMKIVLYETTNLIDIYTKTKPICTLSSTVFKERTTQGLQGDSTFKFLMTPGRDSSLWNGANTAVRYTPNGAANTASVQWTKNGSVVSTAAIANFVANDDSANYVASVTISQPCPSGAIIARDTLKVYGVNNVIQVQEVFDTIKCQNSKVLNATSASALNYTWDNGSTSATRTVSASGRYFIVRRFNALGCNRDTVFYNITKFNLPKIDSFRRIGCFNHQANGQVRLFASGDTSGLKIGTISNPISNVNPILNQTRGNVTYWVRNAGGCADSISLTHDSLSANYSKRVNFCNQDSSGLMRLAPLGGYSPFTYNLTGRATQSVDSFNKITTGIYTIQVVDRNGCSLQRTDTIKPFTNLALTITRDSVKCFGDSTGRIIATLSGGKPGYFYSINNGSFVASGIFNLLKATNYIIKTKDAANCPIDTTIAVFQYPQLIASNTKVKNCPFNANGSISILASGGLAAYEYRLNSGAFQVSSSFVNLLNGPFSFSVRDKNNCVRTISDTLTSYPKPKLNIGLQKNVSCYGLSDGKIRVNTSLGKSPYTYSWSVTGNSDSLVNLSSANYTAFVSDSNACKDTLVVPISQPDSLSAAFSLKDPSCHTSTNGSIKILASGGTLPYQYAINSFSFLPSDSFTGLIGATYTLRIRDSQSCLKTYTRTIVNPTPLQLSMNSDSVKCFGGNDGKIQLQVSGGTPGYTYRINSLPYDTFSQKSNLFSGNYAVSIRDINACQKDSSIQVLTYSAIGMTKATLDTIRCKNGNDGRISITASGGRSPYTYSINGGTFQVSNIFPNLNKGMKYLRVKDANNCVVLDSLFLQEPSGMTPTLTILRNVSCYGLSDGKARVSVTGGSPPYTYLWSTNATLDSTITLNKGNHFVRLTDTKNCKDSVGFAITQPDSLHASFNLYHPKCHNMYGSIKIKPTGGTGPYLCALSIGSFSSLDSFVNIRDTCLIILLDNNQCAKVFRPVLITPPQLLASFKMDSIRCFGASTGKITVNYSGGTGVKTIRNNTVINTGDTVKNLSIGNYLIEVRDANNCIVDSLVNVPQYPDIILTIQKDTVKCYGSATASMTISATGGAGGYSYGINSSTFGPSNLFTGIAAGFQTAKARDQYQCQKSQNVTITQIDSMIITPQLTQNRCFKDSLGKVKFNISGGTAPYLITFNGATVSNLDSFVKLPAGNYPYLIQDKFNCTKSGFITITQPTPLTSNAIIDSVKCFKQNTGQIQILPAGGSPGYLVSFAGQAFGAATIFPNLAAGTYNIKVRDANMCIKDTNVIVRMSDSFYFSFVVDSIDCNNANNGKVTVTPFGGKPPYQYRVNSGLFTSNNIISNLTPTNHTIQIRDNYNCLLNLPVSFLNPSPIVISVDSNIGNLCHNESKGRMQVSSSGGKLPHSYIWTNGNNTNRIVNLIAGSYTVTVRDAKNCNKTLTEVISEPTNFTVGVNQINLKCFGDADGSIALTVTGATPIPSASYLYNWSNGATTSAISNLITGNYTVTITDKNLCTTTRMYNLTQPDSISFNLVKTNSHCAASEDGAITVANLQGGTNPDRYQWSHGPTSLNLLDLEPFKTYTLTITDRNNCKKTASTYIDTMYVLRIKFDTLGIPRCPYSLLNLRMSPLSGSSPHEFSLGSTKNYSGNFLNQVNAKYMILVKDFFECEYRDSIDLVPTDTMTINLLKYPPPCETANIFPVKANVQGGKQPYVFDWPRSYWYKQDSARFNQTGYYEVKVTDAYGCEIKTSLQLRLPDGALHGEIVDKKNLRCYKSNDGKLKIEARGGYSPYTYLWNTKDTSAALSALAANITYTVTITDDENCNYVVSDTLAEPDSLYFTYTYSELLCKENENGTIMISPKGGSLNYVYRVDTNAIYSKGAFFNGLKYGQYYISVKDDSSCLASQPLYLDYKYKMSLTLDTVFQINAGESVFINPTIQLTPSSAFYIPNWSPGEGLSCTDCLSTEFNGYHTTRLNLNLKYGLGCNADYSTLIKVENTQKDELFVPNAFSPSAEKLENQTFKAYANRVLRFEMSVYNRWGEKVFETDDIRVGWDGRYKGEPAQPGIYTYTLRLTKLDGNRIVKSGEVNLF